MISFESELKKEFGILYQPDSNPTPEHIDDFYASKIPTISIQDYYQRILCHTKCETCIIDVMWIYLKRVVYTHNMLLTNYNIHRILSQAFNIAMKFLDDDHISEEKFCNIVGYSQKEYAKLEKCFLRLLYFNCWV